MASMILQRRRNSTSELLRANYESKKIDPLPTTTTTCSTTSSEVDNMPHWGRVTDECADDEGTTTEIAVWTTSTTTTTEAALVASDRSPLTLWPHGKRIYRRRLRTTNPTTPEPLQSSKVTCTGHQL
ncbi:hypothetical protein FOZ60_006583 [Perkinsus olseni]|uniref:Uncharacterized protein n=1 Tax=Perkinsus olseni TaxID=32597 RepID=A0A7J6NNJ3_PEROL|nr:hypothetical protein FOZ60_006583 [Perkinsus olseni]